MTGTRSTTILNETIASLKSTTDHHNKDIQEIHKITSIHTRTLNEMSQQLATILQKLSTIDNAEPNSKNSHIPKAHNCHNLVSSLSRPVKLDFPRFYGKEPTSWVYKANQYFKYYTILESEKLMMASFHMDGDVLIWFQEGKDASLFGN